MSKTILIIGESAIARTVLPTMLRPLGCNLICAVDILSAMHLSESVALDYIIVDNKLRSVSAGSSERLMEMASRSQRLRQVPMRILSGGGEAFSPLELLALCLRGAHEGDFANDNLAEQIPPLIDRIERVADRVARTG